MGGVLVVSGITGFSWRRGGGLLSQLVRKSTAKTTKTVRKKRKKKRSGNMSEWQLSYLHAIIDANSE